MRSPDEDPDNAFVNDPPRGLACNMFDTQEARPNLTPEQKAVLEKASRRDLQERKGQVID